MTGATMMGLPLFLQPKLAISQPGDPYEQEADRVADQVTRMAVPTVQRQCAACAAGRPLCSTCEDERVQVSRKAKGSAGGEAPATVHSVLSSSGQPLSASTRAFFEPRFGHDLSHVRVHTDGHAQQSARAVNALAYTVGSHVVFDAGRYAPHSTDGQRLLAHELTHVVQQSTKDSGGRTLRRQPADREIEMAGEFAGDERKRTWRRYARQLGQQDAARIRQAGTLSAELRDELNTKLRFFVGDAHAVYAEAIKPALMEVGQGGRNDQASNASSGSDVQAIPSVGTFLPRVRAQETYLDNNIKEVNYYTAELAKLHYRDGSTYDLGLVPRWMTPPVVEVDCHTPLNDFRPYEDPRTGTFGYLIESEMKDVPRTMTYQDLIKTRMHPVEFYVLPGSGRVVPSHINQLTAPTLCRVLLDSERRYEEQVAMAADIGLMGTMIVGLYAGAGRFSGAPATATTRTVLSPTARVLAREMDALLAGGGTKAITVEGVTLEGVTVAREGSTLAVRRFASHMPEAARGRGVGLQVTREFEQAAEHVGRLQGAKSVTVDVGIIINPGWRQILEARGYVKVLEKGAWIKTIKL